MRDKKISRDDFIKYLQHMTDDPVKIAYACKVTDYGKNVHGRNLFNKRWTPESNREYIEVITLNGQLAKSRTKFIKYRSWQESVNDFNEDIEITPTIRGIMKLYDL